MSLYLSSGTSIVYSRRLDIGLISEFHVGNLYRHTPDKSWRAYQPKRCDENKDGEINKDRYYTLKFTRIQRYVYPKIIYLHRLVNNNFIVKTLNYIKKFHLMFINNAVFRCILRTATMKRINISPNTGRLNPAYNQIAEVMYVCDLLNLPEDLQKEKK